MNTQNKFFAGLLCIGLLCSSAPTKADPASTLLYAGLTGVSGWYTAKLTLDSFLNTKKSLQTLGELAEFESSTGRAIKIENRNTGTETYATTGALLDVVLNAGVTLLIGFIGTAITGGFWNNFKKSLKSSETTTTNREAQTNNN